jgi:hypothetical protein
MAVDHDEIGGPAPFAPATLQQKSARRLSIH